MYLNDSNDYHTELGDVLLVTLVTASPGAEMRFNRAATCKLSLPWFFFLNIELLHCSFMWKELMLLLVIFSGMIKSEFYSLCDSYFTHIFTAFIVRWVGFFWFF